MLLAVFMVTSTVDNGLGTTRGSLSWAITQVNGDHDTQPDTIDFCLKGTAPFTISPTSPLPMISHRVIIDGTSQPGYSGAPIIQINGSTNGLAGDGLTLGPLSDRSLIRGLCISGFGGGAGIRIESDHNGVLSDYLGTDISGQTPLPNQTGILIDNGSGNLIGGPDTANSLTGVVVLSYGNLISGNTSSGVYLTGASSTNTLEGNFIGTDSTGKVRLHNGSGVLIDSGSNVQRHWRRRTCSLVDLRIDTLAGNIISGNTTGSGIDITGEGTSANVVEGNFVGIDSSGSSAIGNLNGVTIEGGATSNTIGGSSPPTRNIISGSTQAGVDIDGNEHDAKHRRWQLHRH